MTLYLELSYVYMSNYSVINMSFFMTGSSGGIFDQEQGAFVQLKLL